MVQTLSHTDSVYMPISGIKLYIFMNKGIKKDSSSTVSENTEHYVLNVKKTETF